MLDWEPDDNEFRPLAGEGSLVVLADGTVGAANERAAAACGLTVARLVGTRLHDVDAVVIAADGHPLTADECPVVVALRTGDAVRDVELGVRAVGVTTWWWVAAQPLVDEAGSVAGVACTLTPVVAGATPLPRRAPVPLDDAAEADDLEALARLAGLTLPDGLPEPSDASPWARSA